MISRTRSAELFGVATGVAVGCGVTFGPGFAGAGVGVGVGVLSSGIGRNVSGSPKRIGSSDSCCEKPFGTKVAKTNPMRLA